MGFFDRLSNGWRLTQGSFSILKENKQLIIFPIITFVSLLLVMGSFIVGLLALKGWDIEGLQMERSNYYLILFGFYVVNYFVIVFFNTALIHCARLYFNGEEPTISKGLNFSISRIGVIFTWALFAATVGTILKSIQDKAGFLGKIIVGIVGIAWGISTFFVLPIIAYEEVGPFEALKRSANLMKEKWGESLGSSFSFGFIQFILFIAAIIPLSLIGAYLSIPLAVALGVLYFSVVLTIMSAVRNIFIAAVYETINHRPVKEFETTSIDDLFIQK